MLINLHVKNLALIEEAEVDFTNHLNILTGETGAGKSILIGSIQSALGARIPKDMIRNGCRDALIELVFHTDSPAVKNKMDELEIPFEDGEIIISRRITNSRVINKVNNTSISIGKLKELSPLLLDLSGQHENQLLLNPQNHLAIIDSYQKEKIDPVKKKVSTLFCEYQTLEKKLSEQTLGQEQKLREMEFLKYEIQEIEEAALKEGEDDSLEKEYHRMSHAREILSDCSFIHEILSEQNGCAGDLIGDAVQKMNEVEELDEETDELSSQLQTIDALLNDFNRDLSSYISSMEFDEETFSEIEDRLNLINHLKAKYGDSLEAIRNYHDKSVDKYEQLLHYEEYMEEAKREFTNISRKLEEECDRLTRLRQDAAKPLVSAVKDALLDLNFLNVEFSVSFEKTQHFTSQGKDRACFMISTNPGQALRPLHEIASGGELSRIMLAIKSVLADEEGIETLIFDEIDTGISGRTAQKVSERLAIIAKDRQVIAITHLPQIAAMADSHFLIEKTSDSNSTISNIYPLSEEESVRELARMLGGAKITDTVLENAREMRNLTCNFRKENFS
ncbi:MAG: DNA repair protein RecN [Eubacterium sp.]|nr:DNA repair protein RecN [Eubacterium sp.]MDD7209439.1 DNA repair protein RecN [Lachnospiraceae bacterium]MDY5497485.1 DNA repair protein RecN [Anaerobutyricum sp.]